MKYILVLLAAGIFATLAACASPKDGSKNSGGKEESPPQQQQH